MKLKLILFGLLFGIVVTSGCIGGKTTEPTTTTVQESTTSSITSVPEPTTTPIPTTTAPVTTISVETTTSIEEVTTLPTVREFDVKLYRFDYDPDTITVNQGDTVRLKLTSVDVSHGFAISQYKINKYVRPGSEATVEFVADKTGTFSYYCSVPCGSGHGRMRGELIVR